VFLFGSLGFSAENQVGRIDLVYPRPPGDGSPYLFADTAHAAFLFGNISPSSAHLEIEGQEVAVTSDGAFLSFVPLERSPGTKALHLNLIERGRPIATATFPYDFSSEIKEAIADTEGIGSLSFPLLLQVTADHAVTRTMPRGTYDLFPPKGTNFVAKGISGRYFVIDLGNGELTYIERRFVSIDSTAPRETAILGNIAVSSAKEESRVRALISSPRPFRTRLSSDLRDLTVTLYHTVSLVDQIMFNPWAGGVEFVRCPPCGAACSAIEIHCSRPIEEGFNVTYDAEDAAVEIFIRHQPSGSVRSLQGKTIIIDPGHGGTAYGSIGPRRTVEKDIVLMMGKLLAKELERHGARVILTRESDTTLGLYERVDFAREKRADFLISLHANALPDGENPFVRHGSGTYYYQLGSRRAAETVHRRLLQATGLRDDGIFYDDLALVRPTEFPAVLVEVAYMMYPEEEKLLQDAAFQKRVAKGLAKGIHDYFLMR
jgi:N-acetylmuramoyl-L-alanine amidase